VVFVSDLQAEVLAALQTLVPLVVALLDVSVQRSFVEELAAASFADKLFFAGVSFQMVGENCTGDELSVALRAHKALLVMVVLVFVSNAV
jgi:hypothetical protein